ncbi:MAG: KpsF/GutQ family sugar-phosphate isomerase [Holophagaceae bacterium]|nr:KpsF/GutQ family sugar-phosphate isomerase [Holophagaceae bacterium]
MSTKPPKKAIPQKTPGHIVLGAARTALTALEASLERALIDDWLGALKNSKGRLVLSGIGKSGLVAQKISATFASTGCPSFFLHPADALHGDLGMVTDDDIALLLSNSGESEEILRLLPALQREGVPIGCITSKSKSRLAQASRWVFTYSLPEGEGCPLNHAPMASTTLQVIWGDLLAAERIVFSGFSVDGFAKYHPGGNLGAKLLKTKDLMHTEFPHVSPSDKLTKILSSMTAGKFGMTAVVESDKLVGVISDGDIRRALEKAEVAKQNPLDLKAFQIMTAKPTVITQGIQAIEAAKVMESKKITFLIVTDNSKPIGILHIHDLLTAKVI